MIDRLLARVGLARKDNVVNAIVFLRDQERARFGDTMGDKTWWNGSRVAFGYEPETPRFFDQAQEDLLVGRILKEQPFILGPPGTAKAALAKEVYRRMYPSRWTRLRRWFNNRLEWPFVDVSKRGDR